MATAIAELRFALDQIKTFRDIGPSGAHCKRIRDDQGFWKQVAVYLKVHTGADFRHSLCPARTKELYPEFASEDAAPEPGP